jgi:hypothetical protein
MTVVKMVKATRAAMSQANAGLSEPAMTAKIARGWVIVGLIEERVLTMMRKMMSTMGEEATRSETDR